MLTRFLIFIIVISFVSSAFAKKTDEKRFYKKLNYLIKKNKKREFIKSSKYFFKRYPKSRYIPDIKVRLADLETDVYISLKKYKSIIKNYRYYKKKDKVLLKVCNILYLKGKWRELYKNATTGIKISKTNKIKNKFTRYKAIGLMKTEQFASAKREAEKTLDLDHNYKVMSKNLLLLSYLDRKNTGYSREYIYRLREMLLGFQNSEITPANLLLLGDFFEKREDFNKAFTAYSDLKIRYPKAPETLYAIKGIKRLKKYNPKKEEYIPNKKIIKNTSILDINPDIEIKERRDNKVNFAVLIGPFSSKSRAEKIKRIISKSGKVRIVYVRSKYNIYTGFKSTPDSILAFKIRLAEEYGLNGRIVRIQSSNKKKYIYGE